MFEGGGARSDEAMLETTVPVDQIESKLGEHLHPLIASLFERFGVTGLTPDRVATELNRMKANRSGRSEARLRGIAVMLQVSTGKFFKA
jgi:hypothetical protein